MNPEIINCFGREWWTRHRWGSVHTEEAPRANCWYDPSAIIVNETTGQVTLKIQYNPKDFIIDQGSEPPLTIHADYGVGLLCSVEDFGFGRYTLKALLPDGAYLWPAFWLHTDLEGFSEEIDIFEAYSKDTFYKKFRKRLFCKPKFTNWDIESCLHSSIELKNTGVKLPSLEDFNVNPIYNEVTYELFWSPSIMSFYINGVIYRCILNQKTLDRFAQFAGSMFVVINTHIEGANYTKFSLDKYYQDFYINSFTFDPYETNWQKFITSQKLKP